MSPEEIERFFQGVEVEPDRKILQLDHALLDGIPARQEAWLWDHIWGASVIFRTEDVEVSSDDEIEKMVRAECDLKVEMTINRLPDFTYVSYVTYAA